MVRPVPSRRNWIPSRNKAIHRCRRLSWRQAGYSPMAGVQGGNEIDFKIKADVPDEKLEELCQMGASFSPVKDTVSRAVNVEVGLQN